MDISFPTNKNEIDKKFIIKELNLKIGGDINNLQNAHQVANEFVVRTNNLQGWLTFANNQGPTKLSTAIKKAELNSKQIDSLKEKNDQLKAKVQKFLDRTEPLRSELVKRFEALNNLEEVLLYLKSFEKIEDLSNQLKSCKDDEQAVLLYKDLQYLCNQYQKGHRAAYVKEYKHYWHNVIKDNLMQHLEEILKQLKWPFTIPVENSPPTKDVLKKFVDLNKFLFHIQEPEDLISSTITDDFSQETAPCLPIRVLLRPFKKRFKFHFMGPRQTARIDRPEWFLTQTLTWIKLHQSFVWGYVQRVADLHPVHKNIRAVDEFNAGLIALAAERLHTVLGLYHSQGSKGELVDVDAAFAHAVDETLGFHKELVEITGKEENSVLSVLTRAETFVRWLSVEKKYALSKMDEILGNEQWSEPVGSGVGSAVGCALWVPRAADLFIALLHTVEERYKVLPQPGHRLHFLELQLELIEEWRVRLTQLMNAALASMNAMDAPVRLDAPKHLTATVNAAHHTRTVLLQWAHSLHYLQLHYYRSQFHNFTAQQHREVTVSSRSTSHSSDEKHDEEREKKPSRADVEPDEVMSLREVENRAKTMALNEVSRSSSIVPNLTVEDIASPIVNLPVAEALPGDDLAEEAGVFAESPALLAHLRDAGLDALADCIFTEFKNSLKDYKKQKWHAMLVVEQMALEVSSALCRPLATICARMTRASDTLAPPLALKLRAQCALALDHYLFKEVVLENWFNTGGTVQFTHDVKRNLIPAFLPSCNVSGIKVNPLPKLVEACILLNLDYDDARRLRALLSKQPTAADEQLTNINVHHIEPPKALQILNQRTDLRELSSPTTVMELF